MKNPIVIAPLVVLVGCGGSGWTEEAPLASPRFHHSATLLDDGDVLVCGGYDVQDASLPSCERWDGKSWSTAASLPRGRAEHSATKLDDGKVLVAGGYVGDAQVASAALYDADNDTWTEIDDMPFGRGGHSATLMADGRVFLHGGTTDFNSPGPMIFDAVSLTWTNLEIERHPRRDHGIALMPDGKLLVAGGREEVDPDTRRLVTTKSAPRFDPAITDWDSETELFEGRASMAMGADGSGLAVIAGGSTLAEPTQGDMTDTIEVFEGGGWTALPALLSEARQNSASVMTSAGKLVVIGGDQTPDFASDAVDVVDPALAVVDTLDPMPTARTFATATTLEDGSVLVIGGWNGVYPRTEVERLKVSKQYR